MKNLFGKFSIKVGTSVAIFFAIALVVSFAPRALDHSKAESCSPVYTSPVFNPYPVSLAEDTGFDCTDAPVIAGNVQGAGSWAQSFNANTGDSATLKIYVHNGAATGSGQVMHNVQVQTTVTDSPDGTTHTIQTTLTASNAASKTGSITITTPAGSHLTGLDGMSFSIGDMQPCFDFAQIFRFTVQVVTPAPVSPPSGQISASVGAIYSTSPCLKTGGVTWTTQNVTAAQVDVNDLNDTKGELLFAGANSATGQPTPWLQSGHQYVFILYNTSNGAHTELARTTETVPAFTCTTTPSSFTATATATASASASASCPDGSSATASSSASASATATSSISQQDAQNQAQNQAQSKAQAQAQANAQAAASVKCPSAPNSFNASATATATGSATVSCPFGGTATASASASASATATSGISQQDAQNQAQNQAQANAQTQANANAQAAATVKCPGAPVCVINSNFALNANTPVKQGSTYSVYLTWSSTGSNQIKITQINPGSTSEATVATGGNSGSQNIGNLQPGSTYIFKMYDTSSCGGLLTSTQVTTPAVIGQLVCAADQAAYNVNDAVVFRATGGTGGYSWTNGGSPMTGSGTVFNTSYSTGGTKTVGVLSQDGQTTSCNVLINAPQTQTAGNCNNDSNSCNTNTNTNTDTNTNSTNSSNQNNNNNINGDNNVVTNTNNSCVNNSCNTVFINQAGNTVPYNQYSQLSLTKMVSANGSTYQNSVSVNNGQTVQFQIVVTNVGNSTANNVRITDNLPSGLSYASGNNFQNNYFVGTLSAGQSQTFNFSATVNGNNGGSIQNVANASSDNAGTAQASAWVFVNNNVVQGCTYNCAPTGSVNLAYSKRAFNETQNADAQSVNAAKEDFITYTLTVTNNGTIPADNFVITDDLSQVLPYADVSDNGGGNLNGNVINYPGISVPANGSVSRSFKVRVKYSLADNLSYVMTNTYGNTVTIHINTPQVGTFTAPKTGADTMGLVFSTFLTASAAIIRKRKSLVKMIFS